MWTMGLEVISRSSVSLKAIVYQSSTKKKERKKRKKERKRERERKKERKEKEKEKEKKKKKKEEKEKEKEKERKNPQEINCIVHKITKNKNGIKRDAWVAQWLSVCLRPRA